MNFLKRLLGRKEAKSTQSNNKIGSVDIIWYANKEAVPQIASMGAASGFGLMGAVSALMGMKGSPQDLIKSAGQISLSPIRKAWCLTTPIYKKRDGGIYVLFEKIDDDTCKREELEFLGTIDAKYYAAALCQENGIDATNVVV